MTTYTYADVTAVQGMIDASIAMMDGFMVPPNVWKLIIDDDYGNPDRVILDCAC